MIEEDRPYMERAIDLARRGAGLVSPNPLVGSLLVKDGQIVGEGFHRYDLLKHAEINALEMAGELARGATLYCSLEPCCHHGRTPPCTDALIDAGISRAVIAMTDPDNRVNGRGIEQLRRAGIEVEVGLNEMEARRLNEIYLKFIATGLPFVHAVLIRDDENDSRTLPGNWVWQPSSEFSEMASQYDALVLGDHPEVNRMIARSIARRVRHRPLEVASALDTTPEVLLFPYRMPDVVSFDTPDGLRSILKSWADMGATGVLVFPFFKDQGFLDALGPLDKATLIHPSEVRKEARDPFEAIESVIESWSGQVEVTGYLKRANE